MTTIDAASARRTPGSGVVRALALLASIGLAGCESATSLFGSSNNGPDLSVAQPAPAPVQPALARIAVAPVIGAPDAIGKQIQQEFIGAVERQRVAVTRNPDERADYTLRGYVVAAKERGGTKVSYIWDVTDNAGRRVNRITGEEMAPANAAKDPWTAVTAEVAQSIGQKSAGSLVTWLPSQTANAAVASNGAAQPAGVGAQTQAGGTPTPPPTATAAATRQPIAATGPTTGSIGREGEIAATVPSVAGAPGDGGQSLASALQRELGKNGVALSDRPTASTYRVEGKVTLGQAREGKQSIQIDWNVKDARGKSLGTVSQKNEIPEGSLDGSWGKTADLAASAAAQGILKLLPQQAKASN